jgi:hypothetical protein
VAGHVKLRNYSDSSIGRKRDNIADLILGVKQTFRAQTMQSGKSLGFHPESLVVAEVPMKYVVLKRGHSIQRALDVWHWNKVAGAIE